MGIWTTDKPALSLLTPVLPQVALVFPKIQYNIALKPFQMILNVIILYNYNRYYTF